MKNNLKYTTILSSLFIATLLNSCAASPEDENSSEGEQTQSVNNVTTPNTKSITSSYVIGFYNVENLFDTKDDPYTEDESFLPTSEKKWDDNKYNKKLRDLEHVIVALNPTNVGPDVLGLCEVENKQVVLDLIAQAGLSNKNYEVVHYESPDTRGIDVAMIFDADKFKLITTESIEVSMPEDPAIKTRDILYCQLQAISNSEIIHYYTNHWSSRRKGENETFFKRKNCAEALLGHLNEMHLNYEEDNIIIMGDMNDYPDNKSIYDVLGAKEVSINSDLVNLQYENHKNGKGTYNYKGDWGCLDNVIVSNALIDNLDKEDATIFNEDWVMYFNKNGDASPNKTYGGNKYYGGFSDHLPVYFKIQL